MQNWQKLIDGFHDYIGRALKPLREKTEALDYRLAAVEMAARESGMKLLEPNAMLLGRLQEATTKKRVRWDHVRKNWKTIE